MKCLEPDVDLHAKGMVPFVSGVWQLQRCLFLQRLQRFPDSLVATLSPLLRSKAPEISISGGTGAGKPRALVPLLRVPLSVTTGP